MQPKHTGKDVAMALLSLAGFLLLAILISFSLKESLILIVLSFLIAYIFNPLVNRLEKKYNKLSRKRTGIIIACIVFCFILIIPAVFIPFAIGQINDLFTHMPMLAEKVNNGIIQPFNTKFHTHFSLNLSWLQKELVDKVLNQKQSVNNIIIPVAQNGFYAINGFISLVLIPLLLFYIVGSWNYILSLFESIIPRRYVDTVLNVVKDIDISLSYYLRGQLWVMLIMAGVYALLLNIAGLKAATIIGIITGLVVFIPYLGFIFGAFLAMAMAFVNFQDMAQIFKVIIALGLGSFIENFIATPYLIGDSIGLNPILIVFALIICGNLFGIIGVIASLPITAISVVLIKHAYNYYLETVYYQKKSTR